MGYAYVEKGEPGRAAELLRESLEIDPNSSLAQSELAYIEQVFKDANGVMQAAESAYDEVLLNAHLDNPEATQHWRQGDARLKAGDLGAAEDAFRRSLTLEPANEVALNALSYIELLRCRVRTKPLIEAIRLRSVRDSASFISGLASSPHPSADPDRASRLNLQYQEDLRRWSSLPFWKRFGKRPKSPTGI